MSSLLGIGGGGNVGAAGGGDFYSYSIDQSLRLDGSTAYLSKSDFAASTDTTKRTFSTWVKRGNPEGVGAYNHIISAGSSAIDGFGFANGTAKLQWLQGGLVTKDGVRDLRDTIAWYHIFTTWNATDNEVYIYVNGELDYSSTGSISALSKLGNTGHTTYIGKRSNAGVYIHGYLAETVFLDGTIGDVNDFGELVNGIWVPKNISAASLTYGTNGFYLDYADSSDLGKDVSGQGNHFTSNNLAAEDQVLDSPTNNFATFNALDNLNWLSQGLTNETYAQGNLQASGTSWMTRCTFPLDSGKWYWEVRKTNYVTIGIYETDGASSNSNHAYYYYNGNINDATSNRSSPTVVYSGTNHADGTIIGVEFDADNLTLEFYANGVSLYKITGLDDAKYTASFGTAANTTFQVNFGQDPTFCGQFTGADVGTQTDENGYGLFKYEPSAGFLAICTANLPEPAIGPNSATQADDYFNTALYTGNGSTQSITGVGFQPDWTVISDRNYTGAHNRHSMDVLRSGQRLRIDGSAGVDGSGPTGFSFTSDGFDIGADGLSNANTINYVSWNWKAGGTASSIAVDAYSAGVPSIASSVSANQDAGFSIVSYTGNLTLGETVGHGLSEKPELIIVKNRDSAQNWNVWNKDLTSEKVLYLNLTNAENNSPASFGTHTNQVFGVDNSVESNGSGNAMIAYCFHSVDGFSKVGSYVGNASTDGTFVYTGFRPAFLLTKMKTNGSQWTIIDNTRNTYNAVDKGIVLNATVAEATGSSSATPFVDFVSNGFKIRSSQAQMNQSGDTFIYLAFAEAPFKYANAR